MANKTVKTRIQSKHETEANWNQATNFIPLKGEIIIYDPDSTYNYPRIKVGDGVTNVIALKFVTEGVSKQITDGLAGKLSTSGKAADSDKLDGFDSSYFAVAETVNAALLSKANSADVYSKTETGTQISNAINALDFTAPTASGTTTSFIDSVSQTNGKISATKKTITSASTSATGIVKLSSAVNSTSETLAATPKAVKTAYDKAVAAAADAASRAPASHGHDYIQNGTVGMKVSDSNEVSFASNANYIYFGSDNRMNSTGIVDTYKFGKHAGAAAAADGNIECGSLVAGRTLKGGTVTVGNAATLQYDSTNECLNFVFA